MIVQHRVGLVAEDAFNEAGEQGLQGPAGKNGSDGKSGVPGIPGVQGEAGLEGRSLNPRGQFRYGQAYNRLDLVRDNDASYVCLEDGTKSSPPGKRWQVVARDGQDGEDGVSQRGPRGLPGTTTIVGGGSAESIPAVFDDACEIGMAVFVSSQNHVANAGAAALATAGVVGLCSAQVGAGGTSLYQTEGQVTREDWSPVVGSTLLTPGSLYFLGTDGQLTEVAPTNFGEVVIVCGRAVNETTLDIEISTAVVLAEEWPE